MNYLRKLIRDWLGFSRTEANGFLILLPIIVALISSAPIYRWWISSQPINNQSDQKKLDSLVALLNAEQTLQSTPNKTITAETKSVSFFEFNPNTASVETLESLGFSKHLSKRIANYRQKNGVFRVKSDLLKMYGMDSTLYHRLYMYIQLPETLEKKTEFKTFSKTESKKEALTFDINEADTTQLKQINGIGSKLSMRIIKFRDRLGGFVSTEQIKEVFGLDSTVVNRLMLASYTLDDFSPKKININTFNENELSAHPYIKKSIAKAIVAYRYQHGNFADVNEIRKIALITSTEADKLIPYLTVKN